jgi:hypothetical protein
MNKDCKWWNTPHKSGYSCGAYQRMGIIMQCGDCKYFEKKR